MITQRCHFCVAYASVSCFSSAADHTRNSLLFHIVIEQGGLGSARSNGVKRRQTGDSGYLLYKGTGVTKYVPLMHGKTTFTVGEGMAMYALVIGTTTRPHAHSLAP